MGVFLWNRSYNWLCDPRVSLKSRRSGTKVKRKVHKKWVGFTYSTGHSVSWNVQIKMLTWLRDGVFFSMTKWKSTRISHKPLTDKLYQVTTSHNDKPTILWQCPKTRNRMLSQPSSRLNTDWYPWFQEFCWYASYSYWPYSRMHPTPHQKSKQLDWN